MLEPERLWRLVSTATQLGMQCEIHTTGTLIDDDMIRKVHKRPVRFVLLVAAMEAEEFDSYVGVPGSWSRFQEGITALRSSGTSFSAKTPVSFNSLEKKSTIASWLKEMGATNVAHFLYLSESYGIQTDLRAALGPTCAMDMAVGLYQFARNGQCHSCFDHSYFIAADGRITPCIGQRKAIANLFTSDMADILRKGELTSQRSTSRVEITECKSCEFRLGCWACIVRTEQINGTPLTRHWNCRYSPETTTWG